MTDSFASLIQIYGVPIMLLLLFWWSFSLASASGTRSSWAGFLAGLVITSIYIIGQSGSFTQPNLDPFVFSGILYGPLLLLGALGFGVAWGVNRIKETALVGLASMLLSSGSLIALYTYIFNVLNRPVNLFGTLGFCLGVLVYNVFDTKK